MTTEPPILHESGTIHVPLKGGIGDTRRFDHDLCGQDGVIYLVLRHRFGWSTAPMEVRMAHQTYLKHLDRILDDADRRPREVALHDLATGRRHTIWTRNKPTTQDPTYPTARETDTLGNLDEGDRRWAETFVDDLRHRAAMLAENTTMTYTDALTLLIREARQAGRPQENQP